MNKENDINPPDLPETPPHRTSIPAQAAGNSEPAGKETPLLPGKQPEPEPPPVKTLAGFIRDRERGLDIRGMAGLIGFPEEKVEKFLYKLESHGIISKVTDEQGVERFRFGGRSAPDRCATRQAQRHEHNYHYKYEYKYACGHGRGSASGTRQDKNIPLFVQRFNQKYAKQSGRSLLGNVIAFLVMAPAFAWLNVHTSPQISWAFIPVLFWFSGILDDVVRLLSNKAKKKFFNKVPDLNGQKIRLIEKFTDNFRHFFGNLFSYLTFNSFVLLSKLFLLPALPAFLKTAGIQLPAAWNTVLPWLEKGWLVFMVGGWGLGLVGHFIGSVASHFKLKADLKKAGVPLGKELRGLPDIPYEAGFYPEERPVPGPADAGNEPDERYTRMLKKAASLRETIALQINSPDFTDKKWGADIITVIDNYLKKMELLVRQNADIDKLLREMSVSKIDEEIAYYKNKLASDISVMLRSEYEKSLVQWEKHRDSLLQLQEQQEIIHTRLNSSLLALQQFQLNIAKMKAITMEAEGISLERLKKTADELTEYLHYLKESYKELQ